MERLKNELKCDIEIITTYHIIENESAAEPDSHLGEMVKRHMDISYDFVIVSTGSNDISNIDTTSNIINLHSKIVEQNKVLIEIAQDIVSYVSKLLK